MFTNAQIEIHLHASRLSPSKAHSKSACTHREKSGHNPLSQFASIQIRRTVTLHVVQRPAPILNNIFLIRVCQIAKHYFRMCVYLSHCMCAYLEPQPHRGDDARQRFRDNVTASIFNPLMGEWRQAVIFGLVGVEWRFLFCFAFGVLISCEARAWTAEFLLEPLYLYVLSKWVRYIILKVTSSTHTYSLCAEHFVEISVVDWTGRSCMHSIKGKLA